MIHCLLYLVKNSLAISSTQEKFPVNAFIGGIKKKDIYSTLKEPLDQQSDESGNNITFVVIFIQKFIF